MTFRGTFERDLTAFADKEPELKKAADAEDEDTIETILQERFFHRPEMFYSIDKLIKAYGVPAGVSAFVYSVLGHKPLPSRGQIVDDSVGSLAARFNLRYNEQKWISATAHRLAEDPEVLKKFMEGDIVSMFQSSQFNQLGGLSALANFERREEVFQALRDSEFIRQTILGSKEDS